jgi:hypothetical protein
MGPMLAFAMAEWRPIGEGLGNRMLSENAKSEQ